MDPRFTEYLLIRCVEYRNAIMASLFVVQVYSNYPGMGAWPHPAHVHTNICIHTHVNAYRNIYRSRKKIIYISVYVCVGVCMCVCVYVCMYVTNFRRCPILNLVSNKFLARATK